MVTMIRRAGTLLLAAGLLFTVSLAAQNKEPITSVKVGDEAPDFRLRAHTGDWFQLSDYRGKKQVVLAFYVLAFTGG